VIKQNRFLPADHLDRDVHTTPGIEEQVLNASIVRADISRSFEEYLEIFDAFYAEDIEVSSGTGEERIRGKARVGPLLLNFLIPLHVMAEIGGVSISIRNSSIPGDVADETHSEWTLDLVAASARTCTLSWRTFRKWNGPYVIYEHHYDQRQTGGPLTFNDLSLDATNFDDWFPNRHKSHRDLPTHTKGPVRHDARTIDGKSSHRLLEDNRGTGRQGLLGFD